MSDTEPTEPANTAKSTESTELEAVKPHCTICGQWFEHPAGAKLHLMASHPQEERLAHLLDTREIVLPKSNYQDDV